jgi:hypothetical protein
MKRSAKIVALTAALSAFAVAQEPSSGAAPPPTAPVAYVYVSSSPASGKNQINAYSAASTGALTPVAGSPFTSKSLYMALNGKFLFGADYTWIYSYAISSTGALSYVSEFNATQKNPYGSGGPGYLFLDHTGVNLYDGDIYAYGTGSSAYQYFDINNTSGHFYYLGITPDGGVNAGPPLSIIGNNQYGYTSGCYHGSPEILGYRRNSDGSLTPLNIRPPIPTAPPNESYCSYQAAADPTNHVAISMTPYDIYTVVGPPQIAVYTADSSGNLTTKSTMTNMPKTSVTDVTDMSMAPSGALLAVSGTTGLQVFHFNGANPATPYVTLLSGVQVDQEFWDNANHLYAISRSAGKLYVFTVTPTTHSQAPGSPHAITVPENVIVLPKT